jgi:hypothetical protein
MDRYLDKLDEIEDRREARYLDKYYDKSDIYIDNRQIHLHKHEEKSKH